MDHTQARGTCFNCHNGVSAMGKNPGHIQSDNNCDACHTTVAFNPVRVEHADLVSRNACRGCHVGVRASAMPRSHLVTRQECSDCHSTLSWTPAQVDRLAHVIDRMVCEDPDHAYEPEFYERFATEAGWYPGR